MTEYACPNAGEPGVHHEGPAIPHHRRSTEVVEVETPEPGPGQVRLKVSAAGVCHSDEFLMSLPEDQYTHGLPLTLGHEGAGVIDMIGEGLVGVEIGDAVAVYGP